jgi:ribonuclease P protein component
MEHERTERPVESLPRADRVRRRREYQRIQSRGERVHTPHFILMVLARDGATPRIGITVTRKVGTAVARNRVKRVMREVFRRNRRLFPEGADVVVIAKKGAPTLGYAEALGEVDRAARGLEAAIERSRRKRPLDDSCRG